MKALKAFLSYSRRNERDARQVYDELCRVGIDVWFDKEALLGGQIWDQEITKAISEADFFILLLSSKSVDIRGYLHSEIQQALKVRDSIPEGHIYIIPLRLDDFKIPHNLSKMQCVDLFPDRAQGVKRLLQSMQHQANIIRKNNSTSILMVNDAPFKMKVFASYIKSFGFEVRHAFDVASAIDSIKAYHPDVLISDLTHYENDKLITSRAAFEIHEWASENNRELRSIVTCLSYRSGRNEDAKRLGTVCCRRMADIYGRLSELTGVTIDDPLEWVKNAVYITGTRKDLYTTSSIAYELRKKGVNVISDDLCIEGKPWFRPTEFMLLDSATVLLALFSMEDTNKRLMDIITIGKKLGKGLLAVVLDDESFSGSVGMHLDGYGCISFRRRNYAEVIAEIADELDAIINE